MSKKSPILSNVSSKIVSHSFYEKRKDKLNFFFVKWFWFRIRIDHTFTTIKCSNKNHILDNGDFGFLEILDIQILDIQDFLLKFSFIDIVSERLM